MVGGGGETPAVAVSLGSRKGEGRRQASWVGGTASGGKAAWWMVVADGRRHSQPSRRTVAVGEKGARLRRDAGAVGCGEMRGKEDGEG
ncbi:hypothetical protein E2562_027745 [Oryza meyeriana var. granulata]|uniref:DUF834 domain-containing protein n=1 Tax=Oryza meyeriana var. granulata TaxID=110450 RepID=A0A6G1EQJ3_9ORYZ|nr:hypothetical protein E2562_027745 [Oryza meyeriana var. granulata]